MKLRGIVCGLQLVLFLQLGIHETTFSQNFKVVPLGVKGGSDESNLSAYMLAPEGSSDYICLDAGTLHAGIQKAIENRIFKDSASRILKNNVKGYLISHPHLDHVSGLIINSPDDSPKTIYGLPYTMDVLKEKYFTWQSWANFGDQGEKPVLNKYHYQPLVAGQETALTNTAMSVRAFVLSHGNPYQSTAFLVRSKDTYLLYLGDTGADSMEKAGNLLRLWKEISVLVQTKKLKAIFIEVSYPNEQPLNLLFGHLTPSLLMQEMNALANVAGKTAVQGLPVIITHMKPSGNHEAMIKQQLTSLNSLQLRLVFPRQAKMLHF